MTPGAHGGGAGWLSGEIDWDAWRAGYDSMTWEDHQAFYRHIAELFPHQRSFDPDLAQRIFDKIGGKDLEVIELGGWDGALANSMLVPRSDIASWTNYDLVEVPQACRHPSYELVVLERPFWDEPREADVFVATHTIEHLRSHELQRIFDSIDVEWIYLEAPLELAPRNWEGYTGSHILEIGWAGVHAMLEDRGFEYTDLGLWGKAKQRKRQRGPLRVHPGGTIGVLSGDLTRYTDFWVALHNILKPEGTSFVSAQGADIVGNMNTMVAHTVGDWLWILGDDHVFNQDVLLCLLDHDVDVVVPLCLKRSPPYDPVVYSHQNEHGHYVASTDLPEHGLHEVWAAGSAGMLIRRRVLDALPRPVFTTDGGGMNEDLVLCRKIREAGFLIHVDVSTLIGHIGNIEVWPAWTGQEWQIALHLGNGVAMPIKRVIKAMPEPEPVEAFV